MTRWSARTDSPSRLFAFGTECTVGSRPIASLRLARDARTTSSPCSIDSACSRRTMRQCLTSAAGLVECSARCFASARSGRTQPSTSTERRLTGRGRRTRGRSASRRRPASRRPISRPTPSISSSWSRSSRTLTSATRTRGWPSCCEITRPGGVVVATVAGQRDRELLPKGEQERLERDGILFTSWRRGRLKLDGLPDFYQSTYHERSYVEREWPRSGFELVAYVPASINAGQDAVVLRKPPPGATSTLPS